MTLLLDALQSLPLTARRNWSAGARALVHGLLAALLALLGGWAQAQTYTRLSTAYTWDSVSSDTGLYSDDTSSGLINMGFNFPIGGTSYSGVYLNTNGLVNFTTATNSLSNSSPPTTNAPFPALIVYWDDLHSGYGGSSITYGTLGSAPNRRFVISYNNVAQYANSGYRYTFQVALFETGNVEYRYQSMSCCVSSASVGIQISNSDYTGYGDVSTMPGGTAILWAARENSSPGGLSGHVWWGRAGTIGLADNADVVTWSNAANYAKNLSGSATRPKYRNNNAQNINFNPVVEFTGNQYFTVSSMLGNQARSQGHYVIAGYPTANMTNAPVLAEYGVPVNGWDGRFSVHFPHDGDVIWDSADASVSRARYTDTNLLNKASVFTFYKDAVTATPFGVKQAIRKNGLQMASAASPSALTGANGTFSVGQAGSGWRGVMAEGMMLLNTSISNTQALQLESYLGVKYGATLGGDGATGTAYLNTAGGTVWASNTGYHYNVAGIARDDLTKLDQRISRSVNSGDQITATSNATVPSTASVISAQTGVAFATDKSYTIWGDNNGAVSDTAAITAGFIAGRSRSARVWRLQMTGSVPTQLTVCIPDALIPPAFLTGDLTDLKLTGATAADFSTGTSLYTMTAGTCPGTGVGVTTGVPGRYATFDSTVLTGMGGVGYFSVTRKQLDHIEITASSSTGVTCAPTTYTVKACGDATCTSLYTGGLTGTLTLTGTGVTSQPSGGAPFTIAAGSSSTTLSAQVTSVSTATVGATGLSLTPGNAKPVFCGLGVAANSINACTMTVAEAGFVTAVNAHYAGVDQTLSIQAVKKSDVTTTCVPAFANVTRSVRASCTYLNPTSGTRAPTLTAASVAYALNATNNANSACDASGRSVPLAFNASGVATATLRYWDAGATRLNLNYSGSAGTGDDGLLMSGEASYITAPAHFSISGLPGISVVAGTSFNMTVTAQSQGSTGTLVTLPNFGLETPAPSLQLDFVRTGPTGSAAVSGDFVVGSVGSFSGGAVQVTGMRYSEVGAIRPTATLSNYLGSGLNVLGNGSGLGYHWVCAANGASCVIPAGVSGAVSSWVSSGQLVQKLNVSGTVACGPTLLGDTSISGCYFRPMSGVTANSGSVILKPHLLEVSMAPACGSFSYAGQPFGVTLTAKNLAGDITRNYDGGVNTSPNFAKTVSLSDATANANGTLSGSVPASAFSLGVASLANTAATAPVFSFGNKLTAPQTISLRAMDTDGVNSSGYDGAQTLRSGRLQMSNAFGGDKTALQVPLQLQYWSGKSWVKSSDDTCTVIPTASVVRAQTLNHNNSAATWSSAISAVSLSGGSGVITLGAPSPSGTGTVDLAVNLGATTTDVSCLAAHPSSTGAGVPWLRSRQGSCASSFDRDPSARGTFGIYTPETQRSVHVREVF